EAGGRPEVTLAEPLKATGLTEMLRRGLSTEQDIRTQYEADAAAAGSAQLKALFQRLAGHEAYHDRRFAELLAHVEEQRRGRSFTVGSLKPKK
ncbi:MAG TPA: hypothetical protein GX511_06625, partial [Firmicutes bacterium]|nr:hypothetical protein [Bacillota bacterium]